MRKSIEMLAVGDWVVLDSLIRSRFCGYPWKVTGVSNNRIYLESYVTDKATLAVEVKHKKYVARKSVRLAFSTEEAGIAAAEKARELSDRFEAEVRNLEKEHQQRVKAYIDSL